ncbi:MAG: hypothetical protein JXA44_04070 [Methanospirillaceae archaeon]|nr:hypothetical protein [Methanospirillaceae archaeon]
MTDQTTVIKAIMLDIHDMADPDNLLETPTEIKVFCTRIEVYLDELRRIANGEPPEWAGALVA